MTTTTKAVKGIQIVGDGKYPLVPLHAITIIERPDSGDETSKLFYNPRSLKSFENPAMEELRYSIRVDGLQQPPVVRTIGKDGCIDSVELIAGERRIRSCLYISHHDLPCFDEDQASPKQYAKGDVVLYSGRFGTVQEHVDGIVSIKFDADHIGPEETKNCKYSDVFPTVSGRKLYEHVACKVHQDCNDRRALRIAFTENDKSEPLTIQEEIAIVERLEKMGKKQEEIADLLATNVTWVSQTSNFRTQLPAAAYAKLLSGEMTRNVAVNFLSYPAEDREALYQASLKAEQEETATKIRESQLAVEKHEDTQDIHLEEAQEAEEAGDKKEAERLRKKAEAVGKKANKEKERLNRAKAEKGVIRQGHVRKGAETKGLTPRKGKPVDAQALMLMYLDDIEPYLESGIDKVTGEEVPNDFAAIIRRTILALQDGQRDVLEIIREYQFDMGEWDRPASRKKSEPADFDDAADEDAELEEV